MNLCLIASMNLGLNFRIQTEVDFPVPPADLVKNGNKGQSMIRKPLRGLQK